MLLSPKYRRKLTCQENANNSGCANLVEEYILAPHPVEKPSESSSWLGRLHQNLNFSTKISINPPRPTDTLLDSKLQLKLLPIADVQPLHPNQRHKFRSYYSDFQSV